MIFPGHHLPTRTPAERRVKDVAWAKWVAEEAARIKGQRAPLTYIAGLKGRHGASARLVRMMLDRAWYLLDCGQCEAADALLEFVPEADAERLLHDFFPEIYGEPETVAVAPVKRRMARVGDLSEPYISPPTMQRWAARRGFRPH